MQQGAGYAADAAMQRPVKRPVTIQAPPDSQQTAFPAPQVSLLTETSAGIILIFVEESCCEGMQQQPTN
jgi:hypothetical protein